MVDQLVSAPRVRRSDSLRLKHWSVSALLDLQVRSGRTPSLAKRLDSREIHAWNFRSFEIPAHHWEIDFACG